MPLAETSATADERSLRSRHPVQRAALDGVCRHVEWADQRARAWAGAGNSPARLLKRKPSIKSEMPKTTA
jgi:hypothetical protein